MNTTSKMPLVVMATLLAYACGTTEPQPQRAAITVGASSYEPAEVRTTVGTPLTLVFTRTTDEGCGNEIVIASQDIRRPLPLNEPMEVTFTPTEAGSIRFACGMDMLEGTVVVQ